MFDDLIANGGNTVAPDPSCGKTCVLTPKPLLRDIMDAYGDCLDNNINLKEDAIDAVSRAINDFMHDVLAYHVSSMERESLSEDIINLLTSSNTRLTIYSASLAAKNMATQPNSKPYNPVPNNSHGAGQGTVPVAPPTTRKP